MTTVPTAELDELSDQMEKLAAIVTKLDQERAAELEGYATLSGALEAVQKERCAIEKNRENLKKKLEETWNFFYLMAGFSTALVVVIIFQRS